MMTWVVVAGSLFEDLLKQLLGNGVDIGRGFVEDEQLGISQHGTHERDQLFLAQADAVAARRDLCVESLFEPHKKLAKIVGLENLDELLAGVDRDTGNCRTRCCRELFR